MAGGPLAAWSCCGSEGGGGGGGGGVLVWGDRERSRFLAAHDKQAPGRSPKRAQTACDKRPKLGQIISGKSAGGLGPPRTTAQTAHSLLAGPG